MILATVRPEAAEEPKVEATWYLVVSNVSEVSAAMSVPIERAAKNAAIQPLASALEISEFRFQILILRLQTSYFRLAQRQTDRDRRPDAALAADTDRAAVQFHVALGDGQA